MNPVEVRLEPHPTPEQTEQIFRHLVAFNETRAGAASACNLAVFAHQGSEIVGGLVGLTHWNWLSIQYLWVQEAFRKQGLGRQMLLAAEQEARVRGCEHAHLDTFSFQALPFYEALGYSVFGRLEDYPPGHTRFFLQKRDL